MFLEVFVASVAEKDSAEMDFDFVEKMIYFGLFDHDRVRARVLLYALHDNFLVHLKIVEIPAIVVVGMSCRVELVAFGKSFDEVV